MRRTRCPSCGAKIVVEHVTPGKGLTCEHCGEQWIVATVEPVRIDDEFDQSIEAPDCPVRSRFRGPFRAGF
ncbi:MAG: hypothetical protein PVF85_01690 [Anaerolineales bacterium]|jgi:lysine biosynthesis protein LysW